MSDDYNAQLVQVALLYHEDNLTQSEIAEKLFLSRPTISKMLKEAKEKGIIQINIQHPNLNSISLENKLQQKYHLKKVMVTPKISNAERTKTLVGIQAANFIENRLPRINSLGIGWGTTLHEFVEAASYTHCNHLEIVPLMGGIGIQNVKYHSNHLAFKLADKYEADVHYFYAPAIAENEAVKDVFVSTKLYKDIYEKGKKVDLAVSGISNPNSSSTLRKWGYLSEEDAKDLEETGAVGDIFASFFDENAQEVTTPLSNRMTGLKLNDLGDINELLIVATGREKAASIKALLKLDVIDYLIICFDIASEL